MNTTQPPKAYLLNLHARKEIFRYEDEAKLALDLNQPILYFSNQFSLIFSFIKMTKFLSFPNYFNKDFVQTLLSLS